MSKIFAMPAGDLDNVMVNERWPDGRVKSLQATATSNFSVLGGRQFYELALSILGYKVIPSTFFDIRKRGSDFVLTGQGVGHGIGLCQWGARGRADLGMVAEDILEAYFPGTTIVQAAPAVRPRLAQ